MVYPTKEIKKGGYTVHWHIRRGKHTQGDQQSWTLPSASIWVVVTAHSRTQHTWPYPWIGQAFRRKWKTPTSIRPICQGFHSKSQEWKKKCRIFLQHNSTRSLPLSIPAAPARMEAPVCFSRCAGVWPGGVFAKGVWLGVPSGVCPGDTRGGVIAIAISWQRKLGCMVPTSP